MRQNEGACGGMVTSGSDSGVVISFGGGCGYSECVGMGDRGGCGCVYKEMCKTCEGQ